MKRARERIRDRIGLGVDAGNVEWGSFIKTVDKCQVKHSGSSSMGKIAKKKKKERSVFTSLLNR